MVDSSFPQTPDPEEVAVVLRSCRGDILGYVTRLEAEQILESFGGGELVSDESGSPTLLLDDEDARAFRYLDVADLPALLEDRS